MSSTLKIEPHIRGHVAFCNGKVDRVGAKAEQCNAHTQNASDVAAIMDAQVRKDRERKRQELETFKKRVKQRAFEWERTKQLQIAASTTETVASEQKIAEQAVKLDRIKVQRSFEVGQDIEDIRTVASARDSAVPYTQPGTPSASQQARNKLLALKGSSGKVDAEIGKKPSVQFAPNVQYHPVSPLRENTLTNTVRYTHQSSKDANKGRTEPEKMNRFANPGHLEEVKKKQAALQYLLFRRLYSDLEREQARQKHRQQSQAQRVEALKKHKETARRLVEDEVNTFDSFSTVSTEVTDDKERAREWAELMLLEERKQKLQKCRENERYTEALKARLKEKLKTKETDILPLCSCGTSIWDADPYTCANNCPFYRNPKAFEKALAAQLQSLEL